MTKLDELKARLLEVYDLQMADSLLRWDQATYMPPGGAEARGRQMAMLGRIAHEKQTDPELGQLLDHAREVSTPTLPRGLRRGGADPRVARATTTVGEAPGRVRHRVQHAPRRVLPGLDRGAPGERLRERCGRCSRRRST